MTINEAGFVQTSQLPAGVIRQAVRLNYRSSSSFRDVDELMAQRGIEISKQTIRCWTIKFGPLIARRLKKQRWTPSLRWPLDHLACRIGAKRMYLRPAVDDEGEVMEVVIQRWRGAEAQRGC